MIISWAMLKDTLDRACGPLPARKIKDFPSWGKGPLNTDGLDTPFVKPGYKVQVLVAWCADRIILEDLTQSRRSTSLNLHKTGSAVLSYGQF